MPDMVSDAPFLLSSAVTSIASEPAPGRPTSFDVGGRRVPVAYLWRDVISLGDYTHPRTGQRIAVDAPRLEHWSRTVKLMRSRGVDIPVPSDHIEKSGSNRGWIIDAKVEGGRLYLLHQLIGEDAAVEALRNRSSVRIDPVFADSLGNTYRDAITHSALTPVPVIPGQSGAPILASRAGGELYLYDGGAAERATRLFQGPAEPAMSADVRERVARLRG